MAVREKTKFLHLFSKYLLEFPELFPKAFRELGSPRTLGKVLAWMYSWLKDWKCSKAEIVDLRKGRKSRLNSTEGILGHMMVRIVILEMVQGENTSSGG